jgi:excinuclease ABC subunit C
VLTSRKVDKSLGTFYGPFTGVKSMYHVLELIRKLFSLRTCNYVLSAKNIQEQKFKVCLEYHIGNCKAPCVGSITEEEYTKNIQQIQHILKGRLGLVRNHFKEEMILHANKLDFEKAQLFKDKLKSLEDFHASSQVVNPNISNLEVITILSKEDLAICNYFRLMDGMIVATKTYHLKKKINETDEEILETIITEIIEKNHEEGDREIISNLKLDNFPKEIAQVIVPEIGDKRHLIELSLKNCIFHLNKPREENSDEIRTDRILGTLKADFQMQEIPKHIECFDNSNLQGTNPVAAMTCFIDAKPYKKNYRHFHIKTVEGPNDFDSMYEIVYRRYKRVLSDGQSLPQLVVIDGGKGQLSAACRALHDLNIYGKLTIVGIAKRLEEIFFPHDTHPLFISKKSESLKLIQQIRDETHRFAITFHRDTRSKKAIVSEIETFKGIGKKTFELLMQTFQTMSNIKNASVEELSKVIGKKKAELLMESLNKNP